MNDLIDRYKNEIFGSLQGWVAPRQPMMVGIIDSIQKESGIVGDIAEIGVHHGLFLLLLAAARRGDEMVRAFDVFEDQSLNVDASGAGSRDILDAAIGRWYDPAHFDVQKVDSLRIPELSVKTFLPKPVRLFSVDGGHTKVHAANDLRIANEVMCQGGVVILDDFFAVLWPGVTEGYFDFMSGPNSLAPLVYFENKLYLTTRSEQPAMLKSLREKLDALIGEEIHNQMWKYVEISDTICLVRA